MFDVGFSEMIVIAVVALIVIGPEKLPKVARTVGALIGRMQRYVNDVKADINREIELDELKKMHSTVKEAAESIHSSVKETISSFETQASEMNSALTGDAVGKTPAPEPAPQMSDAELSAAIREAEAQAGYNTPAVAEPDIVQASLFADPLPVPPVVAPEPIPVYAAPEAPPLPAATEMAHPTASATPSASATPAAAPAHEPAGRAA